MQLSKYVSFEEMTITEVRDMLDKNRSEAQKFIKPMTRVAEELLEPIRRKFAAPIRINSGFRCPELNQRIGGSATSQHCKGEAVDFTIKGRESYESIVEVIKIIAREMPDLKFGQLLAEHGCIHISLGTKREIAFYDVATKTKTTFTA